LLGALAGEVPKAFDALTVKVYATPGVSPLIIIGEEVEVAVRPPGLEVAI
jgi:hypothetical protein